MERRPPLGSLLILSLLLASRAAHAQEPPVAPPPVADSAARVPPATLIGRVIAGGGIGLAGAEITLQHSDRVHSITDDSGQFHIAGLPSGTNVFNVRRLGFEPATFTAVLKPGRTHRATFSLTEAAHELPTVAISDTALKSHWLDQFETRRNMHRGTFITREQIARGGSRTGVDIVRTVPGIRVIPIRSGSGTGAQVVMTRGSGARACLPTMFYHNTPYSGTLEDFTADDIEALEVYVGVSEIPPELDKTGKGVCGVIVVWTRDPKKRP